MDLTDLRDKTAIVSVGYTAKQGTVPGVTDMSLALEACKNAIEDAGLKREDVDGLLLQPTMGGVHSYNIGAQLGLDLRFTANLDVMGASSGCIAQYAAMAVAFGQANYVLCLYATTGQSGGPGGGGGMGGRPPAGSDFAYGSMGAAMSYALAARRGMHEFGTGPETWKEIAVAQRRWGNLNPRATMYTKTMTYDDYYNARVLVEPFRLFDICQISDSGRAFIVTKAERARDLKHRPVYIMGMGQDHPASNPQQATFLTGNTGAKLSGEQAFKMAAITLKDIDACEIYDCFTYTVEVELMDYGFYGRGEGRDFLKEERLGPGGDFPLNTSGGLLSEAYQMGFTPLTEAVVQLRGEAGERQLGPPTGTKEPEIILVSNNGGVMQTHSTLILRK